ncbi:MAG TPA: hypothetical protein VFO16_06335 [Pseudonocardiaceae bacterium]|nr:hypothetical protein [Pseudonocardiaceae bacterium]
MVRVVGWRVAGLCLVVLAGAAGVGLLLREPRAATGAGRGSAIATASPRPAEPPGSPAVVLAEDAALHPDAERIRAVLQRYFDGINKGDYALWRGAVIPQWARDIGEAAWHAQYRSTLDGGMVVHRLEPRTGGGLLALTSFTSLQNPADAPPELPVRCLRWWVSYPLVGAGEALRLAPSSATANRLAAC